MSDRTVKAILVAEYAAFNAGVNAAGDSVEEFEQKIRRAQEAAADSSGTDKLIKEQQKVRDSSSSTAGELEKVGDELDKLDHQQVSLDGVDTELDRVAKDAPAKGEQIGRGLGDGVGEGLKDLPEKVKPTTDKLPEPFGPAGDQAARNFKDNFDKHRSDFVAFAKTMGDDFYKSFNGDSEKALSELTKLFNKEFDGGGLSASNVWWKSFDKTVKGAAPKEAEGLFAMFTQAAEKAGIEGGDLLGNGIVGGIQNAFKIFQELPPEAQAGVAAAAVAIGLILGPAIMATADAAILGVIGGGGLIAGIVSELHDPAVAAAFSGLATTLKDDMGQAASSFINPLKNAAGILGDAFDSSMPALERFFGALSPAITHLADGANQAIQEISAGLAASGPAAKQVLDAIADVLPEIGYGLAEMFAELATGGSGAADIIRLLGILAAGLLLALGNGIEVGSVLFEGLMIGAEGLLVPLMLILKALSGIPGIGGAAKDALADINNVFHGGATSSKDAASGMKDFATATNSATDAAQAADDAVKNLFDEFAKSANASVQADQTAVAYKDSLVQLTQAIQANGRSLDTNTASGRALKKQFDDTAQAALSAADAARQNAVAQGQDGAGAAHAYSQALAGNITQLAATAEKEGYTKDATAALIAQMFGIPKDIATEFATPGAAAAKKAAQDLEYAIEAIQTKKDIDIYLNVHGQVPDPTPGYGGNTNYGFRYGGIQHAATGLITGAKTAGIYSDGPYTMFAEPATRQEAFIPEETPDVQRARGITEQAAAWHGGHVVWGNGPIQQRPQGGDGAALSPDAIGRALAGYLGPMVGNTTNNFTQVEADPQKIAEKIYFTTKARG